MNTLGKAKEYFQAKGRTLLSWLLGGLLLGAISQGMKVAYGTGGGGEVDLASAEALDIEAAEGTRYFLIAVAPDGTASLVEVDLASFEPEPTFPSALTATPTPIVPASATPSPTQRTPTPAQPTATPRVATPTQVTVQPTFTPQGYPFFSDVNGGDGLRFEVLTLTLRRRDAPSLEGLVVGQYSQGQMVLIRCLYNASAVEVWASEETCHSPMKYWSAVQIGTVKYMELVTD